MSALDLAKGLLDNGIHPPTMYFPLIVHEALMVEPTETESRETLDEACDVFLKLWEQAHTQPQSLHDAPVATPVGRLDEVGAAVTPCCGISHDPADLPVPGHRHRSHENLALEQYLLEHVEPESCILYLWQNRHTVVLGRNQNAWQKCRCAQLEADGGFLARRLSGGGAVFHDLGNLNFTFLVPTQDYDLERQLSVVAQACLGLGLSVERSGRNDVLCQGRKFSGNAFYSHQGKSYHHGTLLVDVDLEAMARYLSPSPAKLQAKGVASVRSRVVNLKQLCPQLTVEEMGRQMELAFGQVYGLPVEIMDPRQLDAQAIQALTEHNRSWSWLYGRKLPFTLQCAQKFDWGELTVQLKADEGVIQEAAVYSDAMDWTLAPQLEAALTGCPLERQALEHRLVEFPKELRELLQSAL